MEVNYLQTSLADFNKEKTLRFDVKFHNVFTKVVETRATTPFLNLFDIEIKTIKNMKPAKYNMLRLAP